jgi:hypothetical protein
MAKAPSREPSAASNGRAVIVRWRSEPSGRRIATLPSRLVVVLQLSFLVDEEHRRGQVAGLLLEQQQFDRRPTHERIAA